MTAISTISLDYQVTIPEALCEKLGWRPGQEPAFLPKGHGVLIIAEPTNEDLVGLARGANTARSPSPLAGEGVARSATDEGSRNGALVCAA